MKFVKILFPVIVFLTFSCQKVKNYSEIPAITFKKLVLKDSLDALQNRVKLCKLIISVVDGDGNIGFNAIDSTKNDSLYHYNLFITPYHKTDSGYFPIHLSIPHYYRIPDITPMGQNKTLKADVQISIDYNIAFFPYDTIRYKFVLFDRDFQKSNTDSTPDIPLKTRDTVISK